MPQKVTVLIPCKNEADNIFDCIQSVVDLADEILIADSGSTDTTLQIVGQLQSQIGCLRLIQREYVNPSDFKNWAIPQARNRWILALDADERVTDSLAQEIREKLKSNSEIHAYCIPRKNIFLGQQIHFSGWQNDAPIRLIDRDHCRYDKRQVHEHLCVAPGKTGTMTEAILHNTCATLQEALEKNIRYGSLGADDLIQSGKRVNIFSMIVRPIFRFLRHFIWKQGFRDGSMGLLLACLAAQGAFVKYATFWMKRKQRITDPLDKTDHASVTDSHKCLADSSTLNQCEALPASYGSPIETSENHRKPRALTMPGIHEKVQSVVQRLPRGTLLDVGAGEGAFSHWAQEQGFEVRATDVNQRDFLVPEIPFTQSNLSHRWPFADNSFDLVVSVEVLEHVENHYHFISECCRICKPTGRIVLSTPNCHSIESRLNVLLSGFDDCAPRPIDYCDREPEKLYMEHIHPAPLPAIELALRRCGFEIESMQFNRQRKLSSALLPIAYPLFWWRTYRQLILSEKKSESRQRNRELMRLFMDRRLLTGRISIFTCRPREIRLPVEPESIESLRQSA